MQKNIIELIRNSFNDLTKTERRIASVILEDPQRVVAENIASLAERTNVSQPSVFRFCKRFGAKGFPDFKFALSSCPVSEAPVQEPLNYEHNEQNNTFDNVCKEQLRIIAKLTSLFRQNDLESFVNHIIEANRCVVYTTPINSISAEIMQQTFINCNKPCENYYDENIFKTNASTLTDKDVIIFLFSEPTDELKATISTLPTKQIYFINISFDLLNKEIYLNLSNNISEYTNTKEELHKNFVCYHSLPSHKNKIKRNSKTCRRQIHNIELFI